MLEMKEIFTDEEFEAVKKQAEEIYTKRVKTRKEKEVEHQNVKEIVSAILDSFWRADLHGKVVKELTISEKYGGMIVVKMETESKTKKDKLKYPEFTKDLEKTVKDIMSEYWNELVWYSVRNVFDHFPNYHASYSSLPKTKTLMVEFDS